MALGHPRGGDQHGGAAVGSFLCQGLRCLTAGVLEGWLQHQVLRWVAGQHQLAVNYEVGVLGGRLGAGGAHFLSIAGDVADHWVDLGERDAQSVGHGCLFRFMGGPLAQKELAAHLDAGLAVILDNVSRGIGFDPSLRKE